MTMPPRDPHAVAIRTIDLSRPVRPLADVSEYAGVRLLVTWESRPLGYVEIANRHQPVSLTRLRHEIVTKLAPQLLQERLRQSFAPPGHISSTTDLATLPAHIPVSVVIATYDRPDDLRNCLRCLTQQDSPRSLEIIVVDNHPASGATPSVATEFPGVVLLNEPRQGLCLCPQSWDFAPVMGASS